MKWTFKYNTLIFLIFLILGLITITSLNLLIFILSQTHFLEEKKQNFDIIISNIQNNLNNLIEEKKQITSEIKKIISEEKNFEEKKKEINLLLKLNPSIKHILIFDKEGYLEEIYPFRRDFLKLYFGSTPMFNDIRRHSFSGPHTFFLDRINYYALSDAYNSKHMVVLFDLIDFNNNLKGLNKIGYFASIVDEKGRIIGHSNELLAKEGANIKTIINNLLNIQEMSKPLIFFVNGQRNLVYSKYLESINKYIFICQNWEQALYHFNFIKREFFIFFLIYLALAIPVSFSISEFLQRSLKRVSNVIKEIRNHNYNITLEKTIFEEFNNFTENLIEIAKDLAQKEEKMSKLFLTSTDAIIISNLEGEIKEINPFGYKMFSYNSPTEVENISKLLQNPEDFYRIKNEVLNKGYLENKDFKFISKDGNIIHGLTSCSLAKDEKGNPLFLILFIRDLTDRIKMQEQLFQAQKMESIGRLAGSIAHDLNNMLTVVSSNNQLIQLLTKDNEKIKKYTEGISGAVDKTKDFIKKLLSFSKRQIYETKNYDINEVLREEIKLLKPTIRENITLSFDLASEPLYVNIDRNQFTQVLLNLLVNAMDAMPEGGDIKIRISKSFIDSYTAQIYSNLKEGAFVCISFSDTGVGIPEEIRDKIFEPFFTTKPEGTGLGLSTVYNIIKQHGGFINVYSEVGIGTTFKIYLPLSDKASVEEVSISEDINFDKMRVLIVEDNQDVRSALEELLRKFGFQVYSFSNPLELLESFHEYRDKFDICLSDVIMPKMSGLQLYRKLKELKPDIKFIFMTGYANNIKEINEAIKEGVKLIQKPFDIREFIRKIKES